MGTWYKNADKVTATLFLNGKIIEEKRSGVLMHGRGNDLLLGSTHTTIGASTWGDHSAGIIDNFRIYNRALSEEEVKALYEFEKAE